MRAPLRLPAGRVAVLLGPDAVRAGTMAQLDEATGRRDGRPSPVQRVRARRDARLADRLDVLAAVTRDRPAILLVDRLTDGLDAAGRRAVLAGLARVAAAGTAVVVDDAEPVAALAYADLALRADADGGLVLDELVVAA
jgi:hypothetical protein